MRVLIASHAAVVDANQQLWDHLARQPGLEVALLAPATWPTELRGRLRFTALPGLAARPFVLRPWLAGTAWRMHLAVYPGAWRVLRAFRPHVVHVDEEPYALATLQLALLAHAVGARVLFKSFQNVDKRFPQPFRSVERLVFALADGALPGTPRVQRVLRAKGYRGPAHVLPFAFDAARFAPEAGASALRTRLGLDRPTVGYVGRLAVEKGIFDLLEAVALLRRAGWDAQALVVGGGPAADAFGRAVAARGLGAVVRLVPAVPHGEVAAYYRAADVVAVPSRTTRGWAEQFGRVAAEAMASGVPVVVSDSGELPHVVGDCGGGLVVPEGDPRALAAALATLLADPPRRRALGAQGRAGVQVHFGLEAVAWRLRRAYDAVRPRRHLTPRAPPHTGR